MGTWGQNKGEKIRICARIRIRIRNKDREQRQTIRI